MSKERNITNLPLDGGALCFNFINTVHSWREEQPHEYLDNYHAVLAWSRKVEILSDEGSSALEQYAAQYPKLAGKALDQLKAAREMLYHFFSAIAATQTAAQTAAQTVTQTVTQAATQAATLSPSLIAQFNTTLSTALAKIQFTIKDQHPVQGWAAPGDDLLLPLWIVMKSAFDILTQEDPERIKECGACGWMFLDQTKNNKRRWCNLSCGSIEKSKKYYLSKKHRELEH